VTDSETPDGPGSLDDPDWVDRIVARAVENAAKVSAGDQDAGPTAGESSHSTEVSTSPRQPQAREGSAPDRPRRPTPEPPERDPADRSATRAGEPTPPLTTTQSEARRARRRGSDPSVAPTRPPGPNNPPDHEADARRDAAARRASVATTATTEASSVFDFEAQDDTETAPTSPAEADETKDRARAVAEWIGVIVVALVVAFLVKTFLLQAFYIPSGSMEPTLHVNDRVLVNKLSYDFHDVNRGDLVVFTRPPGAPSDTDDLIKRVIGLPGDTIELVDGRVFIDGQRLQEPYVPDTLDTVWLGFSTDEARELCGGDAICTVPDEHVFVMGDNRDRSFDSRKFGPIEADSIVGRAFLRIWPITDIGWL